MNVSHVRRRFPRLFSWSALLAAGSILVTVCVFATVFSGNLWSHISSAAETSPAYKSATAFIIPTQLTKEFKEVPLRTEPAKLVPELAEQSGRRTQHAASFAADGINETRAGALPGCSVTAAVTSCDQRVWWSGVLDKPAEVASVSLLNRGDCCADRMRDVTIRTESGQGSEGQALGSCSSIVGGVGPGTWVTSRCAGNTYLSCTVVIERDISPTCSRDPGQGYTGRYPNQVLQLCEVVVMGKVRADNRVNLTGVFEDTFMKSEKAFYVERIAEVHTEEDCAAECTARAAGHCPACVGYQFKKSSSCSTVTQVGGEDESPQAKSFVGTRVQAKRLLRILYQ